MPASSSGPRPKEPTGVVVGVISAAVPERGAEGRLVDRYLDSKIGNRAHHGTVLAVGAASLLDPASCDLAGEHVLVGIRHSGLVGGVVGGGCGQAGLFSRARDRS